MFEDFRYIQQLKRQRATIEEAIRPKLIIVFGGLGGGKSSFLARVGVENMSPAVAQRALQECNKKVDELNKGGFTCFTHQRDHLVYSTFRIEGPTGSGLASKDIDLSRFGLRSAKNTNPQIFPRGSTIIYDESQNGLNSRDGGVTENISGWFEFSRQGGYSVYLAGQRERRIDLNARELAQKIIECDGVEFVKDKIGRVIKTVWTCYEFDNCFAIDKYLQSGKDKTLGKRVKYTFDGDIRLHYDHNAYEGVYYAGAEKRDYDCAESLKKALTVDAVRELTQKKFIVT